MPTEHLYAVDGIDGTTANLIGDDRNSHTVSMAKLPAGTAEGVVLRVPHDEAGEPVWNAARPDPTETERRRAATRDTLERLRRRDPGGDVTL